MAQTMSVSVALRLQDQFTGPVRQLVQQLQGLTRTAQEFNRAMGGTGTNTHFRPHADPGAQPHRQRRAAACRLLPAAWPSHWLVVRGRIRRQPGRQHAPADPAPAAGHRQQQPHERGGAGTWLSVGRNFRSLRLQSQRLARRPGSVPRRQHDGAVPGSWGARSRSRTHQPSDARQSETGPQQSKQHAAGRDLARGRRPDRAGGRRAHPADFALSTARMCSTRSRSL